MYICALAFASPACASGYLLSTRKRPFECSGRRERLFRCELREVGTPLQVRLKCERVLGPAAPGCASGLECRGDAFGNRRLEADEIGCGNIDSTTPHGARRRGVQQLEPRPISSSGTVQGAREDVVDLQRPPHGPDVWRSLVVRPRGRYGTNSNRSSDRETGDDGIGQAESEVIRRAVHIHDVEGDDRERGVGRQRTARVSRPRQEQEEKAGNGQDACRSQQCARTRQSPSPSRCGPGRRGDRGVLDARDEIDRCNKAVTEAGLRLDVPWRTGIVSERGPELLDDVIHSLLEVDVDVGSPELLVNRLSRDELVRVRHEDPQQLEGLWSEPDRALSFA